MNIIMGTKYEILDGDNVKFYRVSDVLTGSTRDMYKLINVDDESDTYIADEDTLKDHAICIAPDAYINMMIAELNGDNNDMDIYVCVNKASDILKDNMTPSLILRQNIYSESKNMMAAGNKLSLIHI